MTHFDSLPRVMIAGDDHFFAQGTDGYLSAIGYDIAGTAKTAEEAIASASAHKPDFIIMGVQLAGSRDGIEAGIEIFSELGIRCLFASRYVDASSRARAAAAKPLGWLTIPFSPENLLLVLSGALQRLRHS